MSTYVLNTCTNTHLHTHTHTHTHLPTYTHARIQMYIQYSVTSMTYMLIIFGCFEIKTDIYPHIQNSLVETRVSKL